MAPRDSEPPPSDSAPSLADIDSSASVVRLPPANDAQPVTLPREIVADFLSRPLTQRWLTSFVRRRVERQRVEDVAQDILEEALKTTSVPPSPHALPKWLKTIALRVVFDDRAKLVRRAKYEGEMKEAALSDETEESADPDGSPEDEDSGDADEASYDPFATMDFGADGFLIRPWLERQVGGDLRDEELLAILLERARSEKTYEQIAVARGMTLTALSARIFQFKKKYLPRYERYRRDRMLLFFLLGGAAVVALALAMWILWPKAGGVDRSPNAPPLRPSGAAPVPVRNGGEEGVSHPRPREGNE